MESPLSFRFPGIRGRRCAAAIAAGGLLLAACKDFGRQPSSPPTALQVVDTTPETQPAPRRSTRQAEESGSRDYPSAADVADGPQGMPRAAGSSPAPSATPAPPPPRSIPPRLDLENLVTAQEQHFANNNRYASNLSYLTLRLIPRSGVTVRIESASDSGWTGRSTMEGWTGSSCVVWVGQVASRPATDRHQLTSPRSGRVACDSL